MEMRKCVEAKQVSRHTGVPPVLGALGVQEVPNSRRLVASRSRHGRDARVTGRRILVRWLLACVFLLAIGSRTSPSFAAEVAAVETRPNIVYILCDDLGYGD